MYRQWAEFRSWYGGVMREFFSLQPLRTTGVILAVASARVTGFLAFVLPLKVILLAGSDGVPRYFRFFIEPEDKSDWIIGLAVASVAFYIVTLLLDIGSRRLTSQVGAHLLDRGGPLAFSGTEEDDVQSYYARFCRISAHALFIGAAFITLLIINTPLLAFIVFAFLCEWFFSAWALSRGKSDSDSGIAGYIRNRLGTYMSVLVSVNFLSGFFVILAPFVLDGSGSILVALVSVLLLRQLLGMASESITTSVGLSHQRDEINAMLLGKRDGAVRAKPEAIEVQEQFSESERLRLVDLHLSEYAQGLPVSTLWQDTPFKHLRSFLIRVSGDSGSAHLYQCQIYSPGRAYLLNNEEVLFNFVHRGRLWAPEVCASFNNGRFRCQIIRYGDDASAERMWADWVYRLQLGLWSVTPPEELVAAFRGSHPLLHERINEKQMGRLTIAVSGAEERALLDRCMMRLADIQEGLKDLPLCIYNEDITRKSIRSTSEGSQPLVVTWGRWTLQPLGAGPLPGLRMNWVKPLLGDLRAHRPDIGDSIEVADLEFANACWRLEQNIRKERYRAALMDLKIAMQRYDERVMRQVV